MRQRILALLAQGKTYSQIVSEIGCAKSTVAYHAKNVKDPPQYKVFDWTEVQRFYDEGHGVRDCRQKFGICASVWYNAKKAGRIITRPRRIPPEILMLPGRGTIRTHLKQRLIEAQLLKEECARCGILQWMGAPLSLHLHHVNGVNNDNRLENLQLLCPNCHSQTPTYAGKNIRQITNK